MKHIKPLNEFLTERKETYFIEVSATGRNIIDAKEIYADNFHRYATNTIESPSSDTYETEKESDAIELLDAFKEAGIKIRKTNIK
jgi:hypothetical protein